MNRDFDCDSVLYAQPMLSPILPNSYAIHEWEIMRRFCLSVDDANASEDLEHAIHGSGAFRHFKHCLHRHKTGEECSLVFPYGFGAA
jgi:hypothetical protein